MLAKFFPVLFSVLFFALSGAVLASPDDCPPGSLPKEKQSTGGAVTWCELDIDGPVLHGPYRAWHPNGVLGVEERYIRGKATGVATYRWPSGNKQAQGRYKESLREGQWVFWDKTGVKAGSVRYLNGAVVAGQLPRWAADWDAAPSAHQPERD